MGIDNAAAKMLLLLRNEPGINLGQSVMLGRQHNYLGPLLRRRIQTEFGLSKKSLPLDSKYADEFLSLLGINNPHILDVSDYEGATVLHDLNTPIPPALTGKYSTVIDIGASEHVYNISQALQNLKDLCKLNGYVLIISPANNWLGHGFYQFSPELFFRSFDTPSGFKIRNLFLIKLKPSGDIWYELNDPKSMGRRGTIITKRPCYVAVIATKVSSSTGQSQPQQSDYESAWAEQSISKLGSLYLNMPWVMRRLIELTMIPTRNRLKNKMKPVRFQWVEGRLVTKER
jgi:hypothetical protein